MKRAATLLLLAAVLAAPIGPLQARDAVRPAADPATERRAMHLAEELRCLVCQNQSLADSNAELALDLKHQIREQLKAGKTDSQVIEFMVARYGDFVLYRPPFKVTTALLWVGPFLLLVAAIASLFLYLRRRRSAPAESDLSAEQRARAEALLAGEPGERK
jgi:cytochrome c-type biogenesis protein CcmH